jgi:hypothetical protein
MRFASLTKAWLLASVLAAFLAGCGTASRPGAAAALPALAPVGPPPAAAPPPPLPPAASPLYRNPTIGMVYLRAHQDAEGRLLGPQVIYQIVEPGGWNLAALDAPARPLPPLAPAPPPAPADSPSPLLDPEQAARITVTGLMQKADRPQAEAEAGAAGGGRTAVYDAEAGWLIVPPGPTPSP